MTPLPGLARPLAGAPLVAPKPRREDPTQRMADLRLSVVLSSTDGRLVTLTPEDFAAEARSGGRGSLVKKAEALGVKFGTGATEVNRAELFAALMQACERGVHDQTIDLSRPVAAPIYDGIDSELNTGLTQGAAAVSIGGSTGLDRAFDVSGKAVDAPARDGWAIFLDVLVTILTRLLTLGIWSPDTRTFQGKITESDWRTHANSIAMAGGSSLKQAVMGTSAAQSEARLLEIVKKANPDIADVEAKNIAHVMNDELRRLYGEQRLDDAKLDGLQRAYFAAGPSDLGAEPGVFLQTALKPNTEIGQLLVNANSPAAVQAVLSLSLDGFSKLDATSQVQLAHQVFTVKGDADVAAATTAFASSQALQTLPASVRRNLLAALAETKGEKEDMVLAQKLAQTLGNPRADDTVKEAASKLLGTIASLEPRARRGEAYRAAASLLTLDAFAALPTAEQRVILSSLRTHELDAAVIADYQRLLSSDRLAALGAVPTSLVIDAIDRATTGAARTALVDVALSPAYATLLPPRRTAVLAATMKCTSKAAADAFIAVIGSAGFVGLTALEQDRLLKRYADGGRTVQEAFGALPPALDAIRSARPPLPEALRKTLLELLEKAPASELLARSKAVTEVAPRLLSLNAPFDRALVLAALGFGHYSDARIAAVKLLLADESFVKNTGAPRVDEENRTRLLELLGHVDDAHATAIAALGVDDDFARLSGAGALMLLVIAEHRSPEYLRSVRLVTGRQPFVSMPADVQEVFLRSMARATPTQMHEAAPAAIAAKMNDATFKALPLAEQRAQLMALAAESLVKSDPALLAAIGALAADAKFKALPANLREMVMAQTINWTNATSIDFMRRMCGASWFTSPTPIPAQAPVDGPPALAGHPAYSAFEQQTVMLNLLGCEGKRIESLASGSTQRKLIEATYGRFLPPTGTYNLRMNWFSFSGGGGTGGTASNGTLRINIGPFRTDARPIDRRADWQPLDAAVGSEWFMLWTLRHVPSHEVNHLTNGDVVAETHQYFMGEYGAWYVGVRAELGRDPTPRECYDRAMYFFSTTDGAYLSIRKALLETKTIPAQDGPPPTPMKIETGPEARKVLAFLAPLAPRPPGPLTPGTPAYTAWIEDPDQASAIAGDPSATPPVTSTWAGAHLSNTPPASGPVPDIGGPADASKRDMENKATGPTFAANAPASAPHDHDEGANVSKDRLGVAKKIEASF